MPSDIHLTIRWRRAILTPRLKASPSVKLVALALSVHMDPDGGNCFPSQALLAAETGLSVRSVMRSLAWLKKNRLLKVSSGARSKGKGWRYHIYFPTIPPVIVVTPCHDEIPVRGDTMSYYQTRRRRGRARTAKRERSHNPPINFSLPEEQPEEVGKGGIQHRPSDQRERASPSADLSPTIPLAASGQ